MVDGVYQDIVEVLKPGVRENEIVALANKRLYEMGSDQVEAINAISGERCNPHPHNFTDRLIRPGDQAFFDIIHSFNGYRTCYYRTFAVGSATPSQRDAYTKAREWMDAAIAAIKPGVGTDEIAAVLAAGRGVRLRERDGGLRAAVRARPRARPARAADHLAAQLHEGADRAAGRHGVRAGDVLPGRATGSRRRGSRRRSSSPRTARASSRSSRPRTSSSPTPTEQGASHAADELADLLTDLFIGGKWRAGRRTAAGSTCWTRPPAEVLAIGRRRHASTTRSPRSTPRDAAAAGWAGHRAARARRDPAPRVRADDRARPSELARLISLENGKALRRRPRRGRLRGRVLPLVRRGGRPGRRARCMTAPSGANRILVAPAAGRHLRAGHAVELPGRDGDPQDRPGAGRRLHRASSSRPATPR